MRSDPTWSFLLQRTHDAIAVFDLNTKEKLWEMDIKNVDRYIELGSDYLYLGSYKESDKRWTFDEEKPYVAFPGFVMDQNDTILISKDDQKYLFWDIKNGNYLGKLSIFNKTDGIRFSPDNYFIATIYDNKLINIWGVKKGKQ